MSTLPTRRTLLTATGGGLALAGLAACTQDTDAAEPPTTGTSAGTGTVTVEHALGTATFDTVPERIVAFSSQWIDALLALDVTPVGYLGTAAGGDDRDLYPWEGAMPADAVQLPVSAEGVVPFEQVAALAPDLVLGDWSVTSDDTGYSRLSEMATTIVLLGDGDVDPWEDQMAALGRILRREDDAAAVVAAAHADIDAVAAEHPFLAGRTFLLAQFVFATQQLVIVANPEDGASQLFARLGMELPPALVEEVGDAGRLVLSPERVDALSADLVVFLPNGGTEADLAALPGWTDLPAVVNGGIAYVDYATVVGFNTPSALSVTSVLGTIEPALAAAGTA